MPSHRSTAGSTIDRVPSRKRHRGRDGRFKAIGALRQHVTRLERRLDRGWFPRCLWGPPRRGGTDAAFFARLVATDHPVTVSANGTGRREVAQAHARPWRQARDL